MTVLSHSDRMVLSHLANGPALPAASRVALRVAWMIQMWTQRRRTRIQLRDLDPHMLHDIGLTPNGASLESRKPFWRA